MHRPTALLMSMTFLFPLGGCATSTIDDRRDPYESINRRVFSFNSQLDAAVVEPIARGYRAVTNEPVRGGVSNFVSNLGEPVVFTNEILQGQFQGAAGTAGRFLINTTVGVVGVFDPSTRIGLKGADEDFGQTLGVWGIASGPYLVVPIIGPSSPRDLFGIGVDVATNPINQLSFDSAGAARVGVIALDGFSTRERALERVEDLFATQLDPYTTVRRLHLRNRAEKIGNRDLSPRETEEVSERELDF